MGPSSHGSGEEEANEATDDFPAHLQPQQQASMTTPSLDVESRVDGGDENALAASAFADFERGYNAKKEAGTNSMEDDIEFMRYRSQEQARRKRVVEEARALPSPSPEPFENEDDAYGDCNGGPRYNSDLELLCGPPQPRRNLKRHAEDEEPEEEGEEGEEEEEEEEEIMDQEAQPVLNDNDTDLMSKRGRKRVKKADDQNASNPAPKKRGRPAGVRNGEGKGKKTAPTKRKGKNTDAVSGGRLLDAGSFLTANAIRDANANEADPATYHKAGQEVTKVKHQALKRLLATVPLDQKKTAQMDKKDLLEATKKFAGKGTCRADGLGDWLVNGMKSALKNYQVLGAGFMRERERGVDDPKGGICADTMGFGKTVMTLANCVNDTLFRKRVNEEGPRTTLIVVPSTLVAQWRSEIEKHVKVKENKIKVMTYRSGSRIDSNDDSEMLSSYDFVITTYYEVMNSFPKGEPPVELQTRKEKDEWWSKFYEKKKGLLHRVDFRRIVLDEAQQIKNYKGRTSIACRLIKAELKWALSGTPIVNGPLELYAYFKFLDVPSTGSFKVFRANYYGDDDPEKLRRLEVMLQKFTIRRTHKDKMFGQPILKLPKAGEYTHECKFNDIERAVYEIVRKRMIARINAFSRDNTLQRNYSNVLVMLLRLRQMTSNLILVETVMRDLLEREDLEKLARLTQADAHADEQRQSQLVALRRMLSQNSVENQDDPSSSSSQGASTQRHDLPERDDLVETGNMHGLTYNFKKYLATLRQGKAWEELQARTLCAECRQPPEDPVVTSCYHIFCQPCLETLQHHAALQGVQHARCSACQTEYSRADLCGAYDLVSVVQAEEFESDTEAGPSSRHWKKKQKGQKKAQETKSDEEVVESWINMNGSVLPSAKTIAIKAQIMNWLEADPNCKIIIYTQFITMIRILGKMCDQEGFGYVAFHGKQTLAARDATIEQFRDDREAKIMLASLKCGGVGLNLTMASHVISCEPWWNASCEMQAFGRVFRIGQTETCSFTKLIVSSSIDERLIAMQKRKQAQIDSVMGDENVDGKKLSMIELMQLFGNVKEDGSGRPFIVVENQQTIPRFNQDSEDEGDDE
ncbi:DNA repair protein-like protein rad5 [Phyllosticta citricarpa]